MSYYPADDIQQEDGMDNGGPKREFLTILMKCIRSQRIFDGPKDSKFFTFDSAGKKYLYCVKLKVI